MAFLAVALPAIQSAKLAVAEDQGEVALAQLRDINYVTLQQFFLELRGDKGTHGLRSAVSTLCSPGFRLPAHQPQASSAPTLGLFDVEELRWDACWNIYGLGPIEILNIYQI